MTYEIDFLIDDRSWLSANRRYHWADRAKRVRALRRLGYATARSLGIPELGTTVVVSHIGYPRAGRADPSNAAPSVKALIDGICDAGVWPDDDSEHVIDGGYRRGPHTGQRGIHQITLTLTPEAP